MRSATKVATDPCHWDRGPSRFRHQRQDSFRPLRRHLAGSKTLTEFHRFRIGAALFWLLACHLSVHESSSFSRVENVFRVLCACYIRSQGGGGWSPRVLSRGWRP